MKLSWPPGAGPTVVTGVGTFVAGLAIPDRPIGRAIVIGAVVLTPVVYLFLVGLHDTKRRLRRSAERILDSLIKAGNILQNQSGYHASLGATDYSSALYTTSLTVWLPGSFDKAVENWRTDVGNALRAAPFTSGAYAFAMDKGGHRLNVPLGKLREMLANIDRWVNYGEN